MKCARLYAEFVYLAKQALRIFRSEFLRLSFEHDPRNFSVDRVVKQSSQQESWRLRQHFMRERAHQLGSQLYLFSRPGGGTEIRVAVPLES